jgi:two-component system sensor histidine kinase BaeS
MRPRASGVAHLGATPERRRLQDPRRGVRFPLMPGSLRFRLPALFLLGIVTAGVLSSVIALRLFQGYSRDSSYEELGREARGIAQLYGDAALRAAEEGTPAPDFAPQALELATGDKLYYVGAPAFPGQESGLQRLPESALPSEVFTESGPLRFEFRPPAETRTFLAVSQPLRLEPEGPVLGAIVVAKPGDVVRDQWVPLVGRLSAAIAIGGLLALLLGLWLSRRISGPVQALAQASDEIASGNYAVQVPVGRGGSEVSHLSERFNEMAAKLAATEERERQFLMSVSHELRTPLTAIKGHVDALRDGLIEEPELVAASLDVVANEATRLERLVGDVLDLAKLRSHRFTVHTEEVDMGRLIEHAYGSFGDEARRREIAFTVDGADGAPTLITDGDRVLQVITNLLQNAFRWTPDGGAVGLALESANGAVRVEVSDTGPGISPEDASRIFSPFVSTDTQGMGLGLPIARELAGALGGRIELDTEPGRGSRFRLVLPARSP